MRTRTTTAATLAALALTLTACGSDDPAPSGETPAASGPASASPAGDGQYETAQDIVDALKAAGLSASKPQEETGTSYITEVGGTPYNLTVAEAGKTPSGNTGINLFPNPEALAAWVPLSKQYGGIAVTADNWAVSLPTKGEAARADSKSLAPKIAEALDGTVQQ